MKLKPTKRHDSVEFKLEAVQQVVLHHQRVIDIARSLAVDASTLRKWIRQYKAEIQGVTPAGKALTPEQRQIQALEKQVRRLEREKEILKQAAVLMSEIRSRAIRCSHGWALAGSPANAGMRPAKSSAGGPPLSSTGERARGVAGFFAAAFCPGQPKYPGVMDLFSRRVVGRAIASSPDAERVCRALETRPIEGRLIFHSGQGSQYSSKKFRRLLWRTQIIQSMSRRGCCYDNSPMERVFRSLKSEWVPAEGYQDMHDAMRDITQYLGGYYNYIRPHSFNGGISPVEYEKQWEEAKRMSGSS